MNATIRGVRIAGIAAAVPAQSEAIEDLAFRTPDYRRRFMAETGVERRRVSPRTQCTSDLAFAAADRLISALDWRRDSVDMLLLVTQTADYELPSTAILLQHRLGLPTDCAAFDINLGCSGYTYGLTTAAGLIAGGLARRALVLAGDTASRGALPSERWQTPPLFGDAASATALERAESAAPIHARLSSDGSRRHAIIQPLGGQREPWRQETFRHELDADGTVIVDRGFRFDGPEIVNFSVREVPKAVTGVLADGQRDPSQVDYFVFHQANRLINDRLRRRLDIPVAKAPSTLGAYGNTSSASIPLTLVAQCREALETRALTLLLCGFGVGLSWGTVLCGTDRVACPPLIEL